jgi:hypothetical protein
LNRISFPVGQDRNRQLAFRKEQIAQQLAKAEAGHIDNGVVVSREERTGMSSVDGGVALAPGTAVTIGDGGQVLTADVCASTRGDTSGRQVIADINYKHVFNKSAVPMAIANTDGTCVFYHNVHVVARRERQVLFMISCVAFKISNQYILSIKKCLTKRTTCTGLLVDCNQHFTGLSGIAPEDLSNWSMFGLIQPEELQETYGWVARVLHSRGGLESNEESYVGRAASAPPLASSSSSSSSPFSSSFAASTSTGASSSRTVKSDELQVYGPPSATASPRSASASSMLLACIESASDFNDSHERCGITSYSYPMSSSDAPSSSSMDPRTLTQRTVLLPCEGTNTSRGSKEDERPGDERPDPLRRKVGKFLSISFVRDQRLSPIYFHLALHDHHETCG